jgi:hypothetical protein
VGKKISVGMDRNTKINILFESISVFKIWMHLQQDYQNEYEEHKHILVFEKNDSAI